MEEKIKKSYSDSVHVADPEKDIDLINQYSLKKMNPEEVLLLTLIFVMISQTEILKNFL